MAMEPISVTRLNEIIERSLMQNGDLLGIFVKGEISSLNKNANSGHIYIDLTDGESLIKCVIWRGTNIRIKDILQKGDEVIVGGSIRYYKNGSQVQFDIRTADISGEGDAALAFQRLKEKLEKEGLFDNKYKKPIPIHPKVIGIVTSGSGAAVEDIVKTIKLRTALTNGIIFPVKVQGEGAAEDMVRMLNYLNDNMADKLDLVIIGRGGGSADDLSAFNDEGLARAIFNLRIPIISAVGHEIDFSISDFVADARAATPTAAAQMAVPEDRELMRKAYDAAQSLRQGLVEKIKYEDLYLDRIRDQIKAGISQYLSYQENEIEKAVLRLKQGDVRSLLKEGYALISDEEGSFIRRAEDMTEGKEYRITFDDGYAIAETRKVVKGESDGK